MSGIFGVYHLNGRRLDRADLARMAVQLSHGATEDTPAWHNDSVGLGPCASLPSNNLSGRPALMVAADVRLDNRNELKQALSLRDNKDLSNERLILAAYEKWGEACPSHLLGDFAFAIWDEGRHRLFCARDPFGLKSFYYYADDRIFVFASEIKALLAVPGVPCRINEERVATYVAGLYDSGAATFYDDVLRLLPGHSLSVNPQARRLHTYWSLDPNREIKFGSDEAYEEAFRSLFTEAVRCRLDTPQRTGVMLSGGLDSSSIACTARHILASSPQTPLNTFSFIFEDVPQSDERPFMDAVLKLGGFNPSFVAGDRISPFSDLEAVLWHVDEPHFAFNLFLGWETWKRARDAGVRTILDGFLGDSTISYGYAYLWELARSGRWRQWLDVVKPLCRQYGPEHKWSAFRFYLGKHALNPLFLDPFRAAWPFSRSSNPGPGLVAEPLRGRIGLDERIRDEEAEQRRIPKTARGLHYSDLTNGVYSVSLEAAGKAAAAQGIELRLPFADRRLIEFCLALPPDQRLKGGASRSILRRGMKGILPEEIRQRPTKGNLGHNFKRALLTTGRDRMDEVLLRNTTVLEPFLNVKALQKTYQRFIAHADDASVAPLWSAVVLGAWLQSVQTRTYDAPILKREDANMMSGLFSGS